jgi:hypothetical protein
MALPLTSGVVRLLARRFPAGRRADREHVDSTSAMPAFSKTKVAFKWSSLLSGLTNYFGARQTEYTSAIGMFCIPDRSKRQDRPFCRCDGRI